MIYTWGQEPPAQLCMIRDESLIHVFPPEGMVWLQELLDIVTMPGPCTWTHHIPSPALPASPDLGVDLLGFGFLIIIFISAAYEM